MKKLFAYLLLTGFVIQSFSQLWVMASFYIDQDYISENLCINRFEAVPICKGQCFLVKELKENEKKQEQQLPDLKQKEIQLFKPVSIAFQFYPEISFQEEVPLSSEPNFITSEFSFAVFHPPRTA